MVSAERHMEAMDKIASLANVRERSVKEVRDRLSKLEFTDEECDEAIDSALRSGLIDEERFTRASIRGKVALGWGRRKIVASLVESGISMELVERCSEEFPDEETFHEMALHELSRRPCRASRPYNSLMSRLVNKGYDSELAHRAVTEFLGCSEPD